MTARRLTDVRFFVDENLLGLAKALAVARPDVVHPGHPLVPELTPGTVDTVWIPRVAELDLVVIGRDKRLRTNPAEIEILRASGLRAFRLASRRNLTTWGYLERIVRRWAEIEEIVASRGPGPWFYSIVESGINEVPV